MTPRPSSRLPLLLLLGLTALLGCQAATNISTVSFEVTVPPETPVNATLLLVGETPSFSVPLVHKDGATFSAQVRLTREQAHSVSVRMKAPMDWQALETAGALAAPQGFTPHAEAESVDFTVARWGPVTTPPTPQTIFEVEAPAITPADATLWLSGNQPELGPWGGGDVKLALAVDGRYATWLSFKAGTSLEFKVTRGTWATVEKSALGAEVDNHTFTTTGGLDRIVVTVGGWADLTKAPPVAHTLTGIVKYHHVIPKDPSLKERDLIVWLPPGYEDPGNTGTYPVLYMHDGQNLMDVVTAFSGEWGVDETAQELIARGEVEPLIIVGVYNTADRIPEYTEVPFPPDYPDAGRADLYGKFLVEELKPLIDGTYRTRPGPESTGLVGSSLGGLVSMYLGIKYPDTFRRLGVVSPSVWWANRDIVHKVQALTTKLPLVIWEDIGTNEGSSDQSETVDDAQALHDALVAKGWKDGTDLKLTVVPGAQHNEKAWSARFPDLLRFLYPHQP